MSSFIIVATVTTAKIIIIFYYGHKIYSLLAMGSIISGFFLFASLFW